MKRRTKKMQERARRRALRELQQRRPGGASRYGRKRAYLAAHGASRYGRKRAYLAAHGGWGFEYAEPKPWW